MCLEEMILGLDGKGVVATTLPCGWLCGKHHQPLEGDEADKGKDDLRFGDNRKHTSLVF